jgi:regulatory protein
MTRRDLSESKNRALDYKAALHRAAALCSSQEQCAEHIREKLKGWSVSDADADRIIEYLLKENFLDDQRYAIHFVKDKFRFNRWGKIKISHMLRQKRISSESIKKAIDQIDEEAYFQVCADLIRSKSDTLKDKNQFARKAKLFRFASGRGFESDLIYRILNMDENE